MSYILTRLSGISRYRPIVGCVTARRSFNPISHSKALTVETSNDLPEFGIQPNKYHQLKCYSTATKTKEKNSQDRIPKILSKLESNGVSLQFDRFTSIRPSLFKNYDVTVEKGFNILKSCSQLLDRSAEGRIKLVNDAWNELVLMLKNPTKDHLILLLQAYRRAGLKSLENYQSFFDKYNCPIDAEIYSELMYILCQNESSMEKAEVLLKEIADKNIEINDKIYNALILGYSKQGIDAVEKVLETMKSKKVPITLDTKTELIKAYVINGNDNKAMELLQKSTEYNSDQLYDIIRIAANNGNEVITAKALSLLPESIQKAKSFVQNLQNICIELVHINRNSTSEIKLDPYQLIVRHLPVPAFVLGESSGYAESIIKEMIVVNESASNILQFCENLIESNRNLYAIHTCCMYALAFKLPLAHDFLTALAAREPLRPHYFWPLFSQSTNQTKSIEIIKFATNLNTSLDIETLSGWVLPKTNILINSQSTIKALTDTGVRMLELKTASIFYLLKRNRIKESLDVANVSKSLIDPFILKPVIIKFIQSINYQKNAHTVATLIRKLQSRCTDKTYDLAGNIAVSICNKSDQTKDFVLTKQLLEDYERVGMKISPTTGHTILNALQKIQKVHIKLEPLVKDMMDFQIFPESYTETVIPKNKTEVEQLEQDLEELQAKKMPVHGVMYRLFLKYVQYEQYDKAIQLKKRCEEMGVINTPAMLSTLLKLWTATNDENKALETLNILEKKHSNFKVDSFKIFDLTTLLISKDRINDANKLIENLVPCTQKNISQLGSNIWRLLSAAGEYGVRHGIKESMAEHFLVQLINLRYCIPSNTLLGPVVKECLDKKNMHEAVTVFEHYVKEYRKTPQSLSLLTLLIELTNSENLTEFSISKEEAIKYMQQVIELIKETHGIEKANVAVILGFACAGNGQQLRKILMNPNVKFNAEHLLSSLKYLKDRSKIGAIISIARSAKGLQHTCLSEETLYEFLLTDFIRTNDYTSAIQLYEDIQSDDDSKISKKFAKTLSELLKKNNQQLPEELKIKIY